MILHLAAECYPAAKSGGLGDVVGALPKYLNQLGVGAGVVIPKYSLKWINSKQWRERWRGEVRLGNRSISFRVEELEGENLGFPLHVVDIPGFYDRDGIYADNHSGYGFGDEIERSLLFQQSVLKWVQNWDVKPSVLHCHDHHTGLVPFMVKYCPEYRNLSHIPTVFTIHNGLYQGAYRWQNISSLPFFDSNAVGMIEWGGLINPMASALKCAWRVTTVSPGYLQELMDSSNGLEPLFKSEWRKCVGILNGIDSQIWNPAEDKYLAHQLKDNNIPHFKWQNKADLLEKFNLRSGYPLIVFIGRLVSEKGADLIPQMVREILYHSPQKAVFAILGTGDKRLMQNFAELEREFPSYVGAALEYNEGLAHRIYAGADFLLMPSQIEPCGLNQFYAMRYGTVPVVRSIGGLRDSVPDIGTPDGSGRGIRFDRYAVDDLTMATYRAIKVWHDEDYLYTLRTKIMGLDFSWETAAQRYIEQYTF